MAFIEISAISKRFGAFQALRDVSLSVAEREFVTFLGPSGCGKTTMLRTLAGFHAPDLGTIHVGDRLMSSPQAIVRPEMRRMGMVFQNYAVWPHLSVFDNVAFGLRVARVPRAEIGMRVAGMLEAVGLEGLERRHPGQLSGGQLQRVALARSLVVEPSILLLDEPLSNLDAKLRERMRAEIKTLQRRTGITFIYVTHDQAEALALSDRIVVFNKGVVQQVGTPRDVYERPANLFVADFMGLVNKLAGVVVGRNGDRARVRIGRQVIETRINDARINDALGTAGEVTVAIRPEAIVLGQAASPGEINVLTGTVIESAFLGNIVEHQVDIGAGILRVQGSRRHDLAPGETVELSVPVAECVAMQDDVQ
ncbi:iron(III) transport system ATP-binding protein [Rhodospirillales bacterium URHD0017]|nr:iron(III) transport system ATP-binding protein [Rhodospirillales bacterium URHD0017]